MKQYIRELGGPANLKDTGSRECYYFYISLHSSLILKEFLTLLSCPCARTASRVRGTATVTKQSQREFSVRDSGPEKRPALRLPRPVTLAWGWTETLREIGLPPLMFEWRLLLRNSLEPGLGWQKDISQTRLSLSISDHSERGATSLS